jgi:hypothetical protein
MQEFSCQRCGQKFGSDEQLQQHDRQLHGGGMGAGEMGRQKPETQGDVGKQR